MTEEERGTAGGSSLEELGQKVDALEGYMREYREAKRSNKTVKIVIVLLIVAVVLVYVLLFAQAMSGLYTGAKRIKEDPQYQEEILEALRKQLNQPQLRQALTESFERIRPQLERELEKATEEFGPEIEAAVGRELTLLYERIDEELNPHLRTASTEIFDKITEEELAVFYENIQSTVLEELRRTGGRLMPKIQEALREEVRVFSESLSADLGFRMKQEFEGLIEYYFELLEMKFPQMTNKEKVAQMAANVQVAFEEASRDVISERLKEHYAALLDIADVLSKFEGDKDATEQQLWEEVKGSLLELMEMKLATEMVAPGLVEEE
jgi:flagellar basal body-associated protein FliL